MKPNVYKALFKRAYPAGGYASNGFFEVNLEDRIKQALIRFSNMWPIEISIEGDAIVDNRLLGMDSLDAVSKMSCHKIIGLILEVNKESVIIALNEYGKFLIDQEILSTDDRVRFALGLFHDQVPYLIKPYIEIKGNYADLANAEEEFYKNFKVEDYDV